MPKLITDNDVLLDKLAALRRSANDYGTSNAPVERLCTEIINAMIEMQAQVNKVETLLRDVMENHGLSAGL